MARAGLQHLPGEPARNGISRFGRARRFLRDFSRRLWTGIDHDDLLGLASQVAYAALFSLFPFLICLVALLPFLPVQGAVGTLLGYARQVMPQEVVNILEQFLIGLTNNPSGSVLGISLLVALYTATRAAMTMMKALNRAYSARDTRHPLKRNFIALCTTVAAALIIPVSLALFILGGDLGQAISLKLGVGHAWVTLWGVLRWPIAALLVMCLVSALYFVLPAVKQKYRLVTYGSLVSTLVWLLASWGLTVYLDNLGRFAKYARTYGSLAGVMVLLLWLFVTAFIFLVGGKINALLEDRGLHRTPQATAPQAAAAPAPVRRGWTVPNKLVAFALVQVALLKLLGRRARL